MPTRGAIRSASLQLRLVWSCRHVPSMLYRFVLCFYCMEKRLQHLTGLFTDAQAHARSRATNPSEPWLSYCRGCHRLSSTTGPMSTTVPMSTTAQCRQLPLCRQLPQCRQLPLCRHLLQCRQLCQCRQLPQCRQYRRQLCQCWGCCGCHRLLPYGRR